MSDYSQKSKLFANQIKAQYKILHAQQKALESLGKKCFNINQNLNSSASTFLTEKSWEDLDRLMFHKVTALKMLSEALTLLSEKLKHQKKEDKEYREDGTRSFSRYDEKLLKTKIAPSSSRQKSRSPSPSKKFLRKQRRQLSKDFSSRDKSPRPRTSTDEPSTKDINSLLFRNNENSIGTETLFANVYQDRTSSSIGDDTQSELRRMENEARERVIYLPQDEKQLIKDLTEQANRKEFLNSQKEDRDEESTLSLLNNALASSTRDKQVESFQEKDSTTDHLFLMNQQARAQDKNSIRTDRFPADRDHFQENDSTTSRMIRDFNRNQQEVDKSMEKKIKNQRVSTSETNPFESDDDSTQQQFADKKRLKDREESTFTAKEEGDTSYLMNALESASRAKDSAPLFLSGKPLFTEDTRSKMVEDFDDQSTSQLIEARNSMINRY